MTRSSALVIAALIAHASLAAQQQPPARSTAAARAESPTATSRPMQLVQGVERDLRVIDRADLSGDERRKYDAARSVAQQARRFQDTRGENEGKAAALAMAASSDLAPLIRRQLQLDRLMAAAEQYRSESVTDAIRALSGMPVTYLSAPVRYIEENRDRLGAEGTALADVNDKTLAALVLLQTELAFQGQYDVSARLEFARRLLGAADAAGLPQRFPERWYIAVAGHLQGDLLLIDALQHVDEAARRFPNDADVLVVAGTFYELLGPPSFELPPRNAQSRFSSGIAMGSGASSRASSGGTVNLGAAPPDDDGYEKLVTAKKTGFSLAEAFYRRALAVNAGNEEAHLRLGRVLSLTSRPDAALSEWRLVASSTAPRIRYLASIFEGIVHEAAGLMDAALASYQAAVRACPSCLSGGIALSHAQRRTGAVETAEETLDAATARDAREAFDDFWWDYPLGALRQRDVLLAQLRGGLR